MLLTIILPIVVVVGVVADIIDDAGVGAIIGGAVTTVLMVGTQMAFWTTLVFAVIERVGLGKKELGLTWRPQNLPEYREGKAVTTHLVVDLAWIGLLIAALVLQQFTFTDVPVLDPANWTFWWPYLIVVLLVEAAYAVWVHRASVRTHVMTAVNALIGLAAAVPMVWLLATGRFFNPEFSFSQIGDGTVGDWVSKALIVVTIVITLWDVVDQGLRTERSRKGLGTKVPGTGVAG